MTGDNKKPALEPAQTEVARSAIGNAAEIGLRWMNNSSLEEWFPLTAEELERLRSQVEMAWVIIANAGGGDWTKEHPDWQKAAAKWRDDAMPTLSAHRAIKHQPR